MEMKIALRPSAFKLIIDGQAHAAGPFFAENTLLSTLDGLGVDKVVLCQSVRPGPKDVWLPFENRQITASSTISFAGNRFLRLAARIMNANKGLRERNEYVLGPEEKALILGRNMARLLNLPLN